MLNVAPLSLIFGSIQVDKNDDDALLTARCCYMLLLCIGVTLLLPCPTDSVTFYTRNNACSILCRVYLHRDKMELSSDMYTVYF